MEFFSWTYLLKKHHERQKYLYLQFEIRLLKYETLFELIQIKVQYRKKTISKFVQPQEAGAFGKNIEKELQKPSRKLKKYVYFIFTVNISSAWNPMQVGFFAKM